jgi:hypothetical protein
MDDGFKYDVFLSYSSIDKDIVRPIAERLRTDDLCVWLDEWEIRAGDHIQSKIEEGLDHSRLLVLCMSANAFGSHWARLESYTFRFRDPMNKERRFIPLRLDTAPIKSSLAQFLYISWLPDQRESSYASLLEACRFGKTGVTAPAKGDGWNIAHPREITIDRGTRQDFAIRIKDTLARRAGMRCSNPACCKLTSGPQSDPNKAINIGVAAHITAASMNGPRYAISLSKRDRSSIANSIWLCQNCAKLIDNDELRYTVELIRNWKEQAEKNALHSVESNNPLEELQKTLPTTPTPLQCLADSSPFYIAGGMGTEVKSYVTRNCDIELKKAAETQTFIWLQGDFQFGKTSLLNRHDTWLGAEWVAVYVDLQGCQRSTDSKFRRHFFAEIEEVLGMRVDWQALKAPLRQRRIAFLLDEFGACRPSQILEILEHFYSLAERASGHLKLIVSVREAPTPFLLTCGVQNPKHRDSWSIIPLKPLTAHEVGWLIDLFPSNPSALLHNRLDQIRLLTNFEPIRVQKLLMNLWQVLSLSVRRFDLDQSFIDQWLDSEKTA